MCKNVYCELTDRESLKEKSLEQLAKYNKRYPGAKMDIVLFDEALAHVIKIVRVMTTPFGHALVVGLGGSGRKSLSRLGAFIVGFQV